MFSKATKAVEKLVKKLIKNEFPELTGVPIVLIFRKKAKPGEDGQIIAGQARVLSSKMFDIYGAAAEIELALPVWKSLSKRGRKQLLWHELKHLRAEMDEETGEPLKDKEDRFILYVEEHDLHLRTFSDELRKFGLSRSDLKVLKILASIYADYRKGKIRKRPEYMFKDGENGEELEIDFG